MAPFLLLVSPMRFLKKLALKFVTMIVMVAVMGALMRYAKPLLMKSAGLPAGLPTGTGTGIGSEGVHFSSEESDLMATVFKSAIRLLTGSASRKELAGELSTKLYAGRADAATMSELGIELLQPGGGPPVPGAPLKPGTVPYSPGGSSTASVDPSAPSGLAHAGNGASRANPSATSAAASSPVGHAAGGLHQVYLTRLQSKAMANPELALAPVVLTGMLLVNGVRRRRRSSLDDLVLPDMNALMPSDSEPYDMTHAVHGLKAEEFELLVALIYQRQGYRVTMPAGLSGGHGIDFTLQRKSERLLVQCKNMRQEHRLPIERVRELHEAVLAAGATRGLFVASCGYTWDARNFAKSKGLVVINARTLDALVAEAHKDDDEDLLAVSSWGPKFMTKVKLTPPICPTCEAEMEWTSASGGTVWVCSQRPDCRGRRSARKYQATAQSAPKAKPTTLAKITESIRFTKLTRLIKPTAPGAPAKLTRLAESARKSAPAATPKPPTACKTKAPSKPTESTKAGTPAPVRLAKLVEAARGAASAKAGGSKQAVEPAKGVVSSATAPATKVARSGTVAEKPGATTPSQTEEEPPVPPARLLAAFPTPKRQAA